MSRFYNLSNYIVKELNLNYQHTQKVELGSPNINRQSVKQTLN